MKLQEYLDIDKLAQYISEGIVSGRRHPTLPLTIYCYTRTATYENIWDDVTERTRGLIVDDEFNIVARSYEKFFNLNHEGRPETSWDALPQEYPIVLDKLDGSLGILWQFDEPCVANPAGVPITGIATKGSFVSEQAIWATSWYHKTCINPQWPEGFTPVFEIIAQTVQTHVVLYDIPDQLILLGLINKETGEEADYNTVYHYAYLNGLNTVEVYNQSIEQAVRADRSNKEGYVLSWPRPGQTPLKVKVKHETFLKLQKIVHAATPKRILEALFNKDYELLQSWEDGLSHELAEYVRGWKDKFTNSYGHILVESKNILNAATRWADNQGAPESRKIIAEYILKSIRSRFSGVVFAMLDGQTELGKNLENVSRAAWKLVTEDFKDELGKVREE
jgi:RNA ligase